MKAETSIACTYKFRSAAKRFARSLSTKEHPISIVEGSEVAIGYAFRFLKFNREFSRFVKDRPTTTLREFYDHCTKEGIIKF